MTDLKDRMLHIENYLREHRGEMLGRLKELVEIESPSDYPEGVNRVGEKMAGWLAPLGFAVNKICQQRYGDHILAEREEPGKPRVLFVGHMDTVFPLGKGWPFCIEGERAYGPGVSDMKAGLVSLVYAFKALLATGTAPVSARVLLNTDEEIGSPTSMGLIPGLAQGVDFGCVLEPAEPDGRVIIRRKGIGKFLITVRGRSAHAGQQPELGINANRELAYQILAAEDLADHDKGTTVNAGRIEGGMAPYIISDWAQAQIDVRVNDEAEQARVEGDMRRLEQAGRVTGTQIEVSGGFHRPPMLPLPGTYRLIDAIEAAAKGCNQQVTFGNGGAASDGNNLAAIGVPVVDGMGPAGGRAHSADEYLDVESFYQRTILLASFLTVLG